MASLVAGDEAAASAAEGREEEEEEEEEEAAATKEDEEEEEFLPGFATLQGYSKALLAQVVQATRSSNGLPVQGDEYEFYSSFPGFNTFCSRLGRRTNKSIERLMRREQLPCFWHVGSGEGEREGEERRGGDVEEKFETLVEANDLLLERVGVLLDEASGVARSQQPVLPASVQEGTAEVASWNKKREASREALGSFKFIHAKNMQRPQTRFREHVDNSNTPFVPVLREKPHALRPLPEVYQRLQTPTSLSALISNSKQWANSPERYTHPYRYELDNLEPQPSQLELQEPHKPRPLADTPFLFVESLTELQELRAELMAATEFAVDLEHHSYRSFLGFVCLMQVSTRDKDYIVDTLSLRDHLHILLDPFTNPAIVKVMHGADWDVPWLQRDFGLYVVGLFDTGQASRVLGLPRHSLAFLLQYCCAVHANKQYQLADWRIRPLPVEMERYAREDTHYLLYIYDRMRNELHRRGNRQHNLLRSVLSRSRDVCLREYSKPLFCEEAYLKLYHRHKKSFNSQQLHCLKLLYAWRDRTAREEDESTGYVMPNHMLFQVAEILPREPQGLLACCNPIPTLLRQQLQEVHLLVQEARATPLTSTLPILSVLHVPPLPGHTHSAALEPGPDGDDKVGAGGPQPPPRPPVLLSGPAVALTTPVLTAFQAALEPELGPALRDKLARIRLSFPDALAKFVAAQALGPAELLMQQRHSIVERRQASLSTALTPSPLTHSQGYPPTPAAVATEMAAGTGGKEVLSVSTGVGGKQGSRRKLSKKRVGNVSVEREEGEIVEEEVEEEMEEEEEEGEEEEEEEEQESTRKRARISEGRSLAPFDYQSAKFTDFTKGPQRPLQSYAPEGDAPQEWGARPRSRVHQRTGQRSHTYTRGHPAQKRRAWPGTRN